MDQATLDGCIAKADRAEVGLAFLDREWDIFLQTEPYGGTIERRAEPGSYLLYYDFSTPPPPRLAAIVGEIAYNLRSALDHLMWREAVECVGAQKAERDSYVITFPCADNAAAFKSHKALPYIGADARTIVERNQPYNRTQGPNPSSLGLLHWFNRVDKHRALHVTSTMTAAMWNPLDVVTEPKAVPLAAIPILHTRALVGKTQVASFNFDPAGPEPDMEVKGTPPLVISYGHSPERYSHWATTINDALSEVRDVINDFANLLP